MNETARDRVNDLNVEKMDELAETKGWWLR
jgi:hypothetical protein